GPVAREAGGRLPAVCGTVFFLASLAQNVIVLTGAGGANFFGEGLTMAPRTLLLVAPLLGAFGAFVAGSATVSNLLFGALLAQAAVASGTNVGDVLALQLVGAGIGNMVALQNIMAVQAA